MNEVQSEYHVFKCSLFFLKHGSMREMTSLIPGKNSSLMKSSDSFPQRSETPLATESQQKLRESRLSLVSLAFDAGKKKRLLSLTRETFARGIAGPVLAFDIRIG